MGRVVQARRRSSRRSHSCGREGEGSGRCADAEPHQWSDGHRPPESNRDRNGGSNGDSHRPVPNGVARAFGDTGSSPDDRDGHLHESDRHSRVSSDGDDHPKYPAHAGRVRHTWDATNRNRRHSRQPNPDNPRGAHGVVDRVDRAASESTAEHDLRAGRVHVPGGTRVGGGLR